ncbi:hypothetical protein NON00_24285 [Roseomonas sp. GC11]|uniref:hypothetical protein n=1 Tax=Roseomonas sp. GC11 TaxID=2950546 RepID=UPI002108D2D9|nr:hypothetical protein [Roseomonas sp. GC11]MCQ4163019.1 hypothetical protein [Roseomonas sp. GC11]
MRAALVAASGVGALALWVWLTGPGSSLPLTLGGGLCALLAGRLTYRLLTPRPGGQDSAPPQDQRGEP